MAMIPKGFVFKPNDEQITRYLLNKVTGSRWPAWCCGVEIPTADLYGSEEPWDVFRDRKGKEQFFFTELKKVGKSKTNQRVCRSVGGNGGVWSNKGQRTSIFGRKRRIAGYRRGFRYENKRGGNPSDSDWLLTEYLLPEYVRRGLDEPFANYALCLLKRKLKKKKKEQKETEEEEEEEEELCAGADFKINDEWLGQELGDDDDAQQLCVPNKAVAEDSAMEGDSSSSRSLVDGLDDLLDLSPVFECSSIPAPPSSSSRSLQEDEWPAEEEDGSDSVLLSPPNSIVTQDFAAAPAIEDFSSSLEEGPKAGDELADFASSHFAAWDEFAGFPWTGMTQDLAAAPQEGPKGGEELADFADFRAAPGHFAAWADFADLQFLLDGGMLPVSVI